MRPPLPRRLSAGIATGALVALVAPAPPATASPNLAGHLIAVRLAGAATGHSPIGDGMAFILGGSGIPTPGPAYVDYAVANYLAPHGFTGTAQVVTTPEELYPFLGWFGGTFDTSVAQGAENLVAAIMSQIATGEVDAANPVVVFGYSQGADVQTSAMTLLAEQGVPSDHVHFVLVGDPANPNGGMLERFNLPDGATPTVPSLGLTFSGATPSDLYPTDIYTREYDGFADFPQYPINLLSVLNAVMGIFFEHTTYLSLTPEQIGAAIALPTSTPDTLTNYYMLPANGLPLLDPLLLIPFLGKPLVDLLQPALSVLANLGYGDIGQGWSPGYADVPTPLGFLPDASVLAQVPQALLDGLGKGISDAVRDLTDPANYLPAALPWLDEMLGLGMLLPGSEFSAFSPVPTTPDDLFGTFPAHTGVPPLDVASALLFTLPDLGLRVFSSELADGNVVDALGIPLAAAIGILPMALIGALI